MAYAKSGCAEIAFEVRMREKERTYEITYIKPVRLWREDLDLVIAQIDATGKAVEIRSEKFVFESVDDLRNAPSFRKDGYLSELSISSRSDKFTTDIDIELKEFSSRVTYSTMDGGAEAAALKILNHLKGAATPLWFRFAPFLLFIAVTIAQNALFIFVGKSTGASSVLTTGLSIVVSIVIIVLFLRWIWRWKPTRVYITSRYDRPTLVARLAIVPIIKWLAVIMATSLLTLLIDRNAPALLARLGL
jgi:hypothetical protein